jgi:hypothetical protein
MQYEYESEREPRSILQVPQLPPFFYLRGYGGRQACRQDQRAIAGPRQRSRMAGQLRGARAKTAVEARIGPPCRTITEDDKYRDDPA